ncbi:DUF1398 domain-containing protein [Lacibacterium aquatile]|uniref:DUF1398 domain-containing protein n=1 Tax=Lacibacterium aquatile TaxID=1168082 RepID=A0ABW5DJG4_9PROT
MDAQLIVLARKCLEGSENNSMTFPQIIADLMTAGFESYWIDFRKATATYYLPNGQSVDLPTHGSESPIAPALDASALERAIGEAQRLVPGYTYKGFCVKAKAAGCAGYLVSFSGRRAVYFGRDGVVHTELFPSAS